MEPKKLSLDWWAVIVAFSFTVLVLTDLVPKVPW
jgi:hypothetical protein